ncbi:MAG: divalent-cation tolerance protein CutA [Spartobacteria bacterium]|nr:divalent-cation tolerance protein CutA [Spartobacteria bacterium]
MEYILIYSTMPDMTEAERIGRVLVEERLVACVNLLGPMHSLYWWDGAVQSGRETVLIAKTRAPNRDAVIKRIVDLHGYECPAVVALPILDGHPAFLDWIAEETVEQSAVQAAPEEEIHRDEQ